MLQCVENKSYIIAFRVLTASLRGTEVAIYDYAVANEEVLGNTSIILIRSHDCNHNTEVINKFRKKFHVYFYTDVLDIERILKLYECKVLYTIAYGERKVNDPTISINGVYKTALHCVFSMNDPHADTYIAISDFLAEKFGKSIETVVPHMISLTPFVNNSNTENYRQELGIPSKAIVFGRHGGLETFNIPYVHDVIKRIVSNKKHIYFIFVNTHKFITHQQIIFLDAIVDDKGKLKFIMACDAMIHARDHGETFGIACGEFSICNKPVITCTSGDISHIKILGKRSITYSNAHQLENILTNFLVIKTKKEKELLELGYSSGKLWDAYSDLYSQKFVILLWWKHLIEPCL